LHVQTDGTTHSSRAVAYIGQITFSRIDNKAVQINISVTESSETFQITSDIVLENFSLNAASAIGGLTSGNAIRYRIKPAGQE